MQKNIIVNWMSFVSFIVITVTGLIHKFAFPEGVHRGGQLEYLGITKSDWGEVHYYFSLFFVVLMIIHLAFHWGWIKAALVSNKK